MAGARPAWMRPEDQRESSTNDQVLRGGPFRVYSVIRVLTRPAA
ncbi:hypothetical protein BH18CHL1_BH18CHL1_08760 [soil metagenome]